MSRKALDVIRAEIDRALKLEYFQMACAFKSLRDRLTTCGDLGCALSSPCAWDSNNIRTEEDVAHPKCPTCGGPVKVVGKTTLRYEPDCACEGEEA